MDPNVINNYISIPIVILCFAIGFAIRNATTIPNNKIPVIAVASGIVLDIIMVLMNKSGLSFNCIVEGAASGLISCGAYDLLVKSLGLNVNIQNKTTTSQLSTDTSDTPKSDESDSNTSHVEDISQK